MARGRWPGHREGRGSVRDKTGSLLDVLGRLSWLKKSPAKQETQVRSLDREDPLEEGMAARSSVLAWRIPWTEELGGLQSMRSQRVRDD